MKTSSSSGSSSNPFVFHDPGGKRWSRLRRVSTLFGLLLFIALVAFVQALFVTPELRLPPSVRNLKGKLRAIQHQVAAPSSKAPAWQKYANTQTGAEHLTKLREALRAQGTPKPSGDREVRAGFVGDGDVDAMESLDLHGNHLTHICPDWATFADADGHLTFEDNQKLFRMATARGVIVIPILTNMAARDWQPEVIESLANGPAERRDRFIISLLNGIQTAHAGGVLLDWEKVDPAYKTNLTALVEQIARALHAVDKELWLTVPMGEEINTFDIPKLGNSVDRFVAMLTDETSDDDQAGPIASQDWFEGWLQVLQGYGNPKKWIATIGAYGYDWTEGKKKAEMITFRDAMSRACSAGLKSVSVQGPSYNAMFSYSEPQGDHTVCFLDAITFLNQIRATRESELGGIAIERLGSEDPQIWDVLSIRDTDAVSANALQRLSKLRSADTVTNVGQGEMVTVDDARDDGHRTIKFGEDGRYTGTYDDFPTYPVVYHEGAGDEHAVTLTFDDGPDPTWTPKILDVLKKYNIKASFFILGTQAEQYPGLVRRIVAEGHEIGNHSYTHPNLSETSPSQIRVELNATQWLLESITGRSTTLFRPPYNADSHPTRVSELTPLKVVQDDLGYLIVLENIDPEDWAKPGADEIVKRVKEQRTQGNIILLHDAGGNRSQTVEALPKIIEYLQTRGDHIVPLSELLHIPKDELMPRVVKGQAPMVRMVTSVGFSIWHRLEQGLWAFMICATGLVVIRGLIICVLASMHHRKKPLVPDFHPPVSVIIAAYNEAKVIRSTLASILASEYQGEMEVIVVDDGSKDDTGDIVEEMARGDARIQLYRQPNGGKSTALRTAVAHAQHEILVFLDADTQFEPTTITGLVQYLDDEQVGAVSGHAKVGNLRTFIARCQGLEYTCGFNLDRRAYSVWNCITVAPGAISALRRSALEDAGGFSHDTLAEDTDLTLAMHRAGYRIEYAHDAIAWTEAPETIRSLAKQRFRWAFGTLQCLWKNRDMVFNPQFEALGWFALPSVWFCQIVLVVITPVVDILLIFSLLTGGATAMGAFFVAFLAMDLLLALLACWMDDEPLYKAWRIIPMRLLYRPLLSWVVWRSIIKAAKGAWVTWGKLERTASLEIPVP
jgi:cellulose synthase/poly-beta-1,6-N-acetylglucosamine synthase-like glycosyltransferase/peptidoglycan/xylan/chitin deacetylase (PgdA/CDA1 family)/spore germination protein YaaH